MKNFIQKLYEAIILYILIYIYIYIYIYLKNITYTKKEEGK